MKNLLYSCGQGRNTCYYVDYLPNAYVFHEKLSNITCSNAHGVVAQTEQYRAQYPVHLTASHILSPLSPQQHWTKSTKRKKSLHGLSLPARGQGTTDLQ